MDFRLDPFEKSYILHEIEGNEWKKGEKMRAQETNNNNNNNGMRQGEETTTFRRLIFSQQYQSKITSA